MAEVTSIRKHPCPECGGDAEWNAGKQALACPYCGTILPWNEGQPAIGANIVEHDLYAALERAHGITAPNALLRQAVKCQSCFAISEFESTHVAQRCDFCGSPSIVPAENLPGAITPESVLPKKLNDGQVRDILRQWYATRWFAPNKLKKAALTDTLHGIYVPYWTFDSHVDADWTAESGEYYYTTEQRRGPDGTMRQERVRHTRWYDSAGNVKHFFDDNLVPGTVGIGPQQLAAIEPFPTEELRAYDDAFVRGWTVERYQIDLRKASQINMSEMERTVELLCARDVPGDTHRNLSVDARYSDRTFKHILVPVWVVSYTYGKRTFQIFVNGYTGALTGERPYSAMKIFLLVLSIILVFALFALLKG